MKKKLLALADLEKLSEKEIKEHLVSSYEADSDEVEKYQVLVAYESVGDYGCDSSSYFLLKDKKTKKLYETSGSHCSCNGFEGQFTPEETTLDYLKSDKFYMCSGGYDSDSNGNISMVKEYIQGMKKANGSGKFKKVNKEVGYESESDSKI
jgi:hypothetical protein